MAKIVRKIRDASNFVTTSAFFDRSKVENDLLTVEAGKVSGSNNGYVIFIQFIPVKLSTSL